MTLDDLEAKLSRVELELVRLDERLIASTKDRQMLHENIFEVRKELANSIKYVQQNLDDAAKKIGELNISVLAKTSDINTSLKILEARVGFYAGLGGLAGGALVSIAVYLLQHFLIK